MELEEFNKIRKVALQEGFKRNTTDQWFKRKSIPKDAQILIFKATSGAISFERMSEMKGK